MTSSPSLITCVLSPPAKGRSIGGPACCPAPFRARLERPEVTKTGEFSNVISGENCSATHTPAEPIRRYERAAPGEIVHIDIKKLGKFNRIGHRITGDRTGQSKTRGIGWEYVHLAIDDHSRLADSEILPDETRDPAYAFSSKTYASFEASA